MILVVPLCLLCSVSGVLFTHKDVDIFVQIGLVVLVGLACKNAILIVEFARQLHLEGKPRLEATAEAARLRLRPILMTSFAFILGVLPLVFAKGAGAEMRWSLGTAVFSGMLGVTLFGIFLTPVFFYVLQGMSEWWPFASAAARRVGSPLMGALAGWAVGFLLARLTHQRVAWEVAIAAAAAALAPSWSSPSNGWQATAGRPRGRPKRRTKGTLRDFKFLHRPPDLRLGLVDRLRAGGRRGGFLAAGGPVSGYHAAHRAGDRASTPARMPRPCATRWASPSKSRSAASKA